IRNTPAGGQIIVQTENETPGGFNLSVTDTGRGIDPSRLASIFTFFEQDEEARKRGIGLGLGLAISKAIVELHGGRISGASEGVGHGAAFQVDLPTVSPPAVVAREIHRAPGAVASTTILLVEDNEDSAQAMAELL